MSGAVWIAWRDTGDYYQPQELAAVFSTEELADAYVARCKEIGDSEVSVGQEPLDQLVPEQVEFQARVSLANGQTCEVLPSWCPVAGVTAMHEPGSTNKSGRGIWGDIRPSRGEAVASARQWRDRSPESVEAAKESAAAEKLRRSEREQKPADEWTKVMRLSQKDAIKHVAASLAKRHKQLEDLMGEGK